MDNLKQENDTMDDLRQELLDSIEDVTEDVVEMTMNELSNNKGDD